MDQHVPGFDAKRGPGNTSAHKFALESVEIAKRFGATQALHDVSVRVEAGTVHALVGENGAGKSTFLGIFAGRLAPSGGAAFVHGRELEYGDPRAARRAGIVAIYQELTIVPALSAQANVFLGQAWSRGGFLAESQMRRRFKELCDDFAVSIQEEVPAGRLPVAQQQLIEIMRGVQSRARVILFDEPTTALAPPERESLFHVMNQLKQRGVTMVFVSHNLEEVLKLADAVTVFRNGELAASAPKAEWTKRTLIRAMLGHELVTRVRDARAGEDESRTDELLRAEGVTVPGLIENLALSVRSGEVVGLGGLVGSGRSTLLRTLAGLERGASGRLWIEGREVAMPTNPRRALELGIALIPEDRKTQGLVLGMRAMDNITMADFSSVSQFGFLSSRRMARRAQVISTDYGFGSEQVGSLVRNLSGGNQQKVLLAKWGHRRPKILLADEPTRGIDVGAKEEILATLARLATEGLAIVVVSSELEEVIAVSDRVVVLSEGRLAGVLDQTHAKLAVGDILHAAFGVLEHEHA
jgi:ABC-type sugar transport system ATPase subunit